MAQKDFYAELDLRYPEIAVCIEQIDRVNPGKKKFYIPVLTPNVDTSSLKTKDNVIYQNNSNIANESSVSISNVTISNYIEMAVPRELCGYIGGKHKVTGQGVQKLQGEGTQSFSNISLTMSGNSIIDGSGTVGPPMGYSSLNVSASLSAMNINGHGTDKYTNIEENVYSNEAEEEFIPADRYIPKGSKWIVVFIGGDINQPQIIGRYYDPES